MDYNNDIINKLINNNNKQNNEWIAHSHSQQWHTLTVTVILYSIYISVEKATHSQVMLLGEELYNDRHLQSCRLIFESVSVPQS